MENKKKSGVGGIVVVLVIVLGFVGYYLITLREASYKNGIESVTMNNRCFLSVL